MSLSNLGLTQPEPPPPRRQFPLIPSIGPVKGIETEAGRAPAAAPKDKHSLEKNIAKIAARLTKAADSSPFAPTKAEKIKNVSEDLSRVEDLYKTALEDNTAYSTELMESIAELEASVEKIDGSITQEAGLGVKTKSIKEKLKELRELLPIRRQYAKITASLDKNLTICNELNLALITGEAEALFDPQLKNYETLLADTNRLIVLCATARMPPHIQLNLVEKSRFVIKQVSDAVGEFRAGALKMIEKELTDALKELEIAKKTVLINKSKNFTAQIEDIQRFQAAVSRLQFLETRYKTTLRSLEKIDQSLLDIFEPKAESKASWWDLSSYLPTLPNMFPSLKEKAEEETDRLAKEYQTIRARVKDDLKQITKLISPLRKVLEDRETEKTVLNRFSSPNGPLLKKALMEPFEKSPVDRTNPEQFLKLKAYFAFIVSLEEKATGIVKESITEARKFAQSKLSYEYENVPAASTLYAEVYSEQIRLQAKEQAKKWEDHVVEDWSEIDLAEPELRGAVANLAIHMLQGATQWAAQYKVIADAARASPKPAMPPTAGHASTEPSASLSPPSSFASAARPAPFGAAPIDLATIEPVVASTQAVFDRNAIPIAKTAFYQATAEEDIAKAEMLKDFIESLPIPLDIELLSVLGGDFFLKGTGLEGYYPEKVMSYYSEILQRKINAAKAHTSYAGEVLTELGLKQMWNEEQAQKIVNQIEIALKIGKAENSSEIAKILEAELNKLKPGETLFLAGGWSSRIRMQGHAVYYEFMRQTNGQYTFRIYNTGAGVESHHTLHTTTKQKAIKTQALFSEIVNISLENILDRPTLQILSDLRFPPPTGQPEYGKKEIYDILLKQFKGQISPHIYSSEDLHTLQRSGTCAFMGWQALFRLTLGDSITYQHDQFKTRLKAVVDYSIQFAKTELSDEVPRRSLTKVTEELARTSADYHRFGVITDSELEYASKKIAEVQDRIRQVEKKYLQIVAESAPTVILGPYVPAGNFSDKAWPIPAAPETATLPLATPYQDFGIKSWQPTAQTLLPKLVEIGKAFELAQTQGLHADAAVNFQLLMQQLPLNWLDHTQNESLFRQLSEPDKQQLISTLSHLCGLSYESLLLSYKTHPERRTILEPRYLAAHMVALTLAAQALESSNIEPKPPAYLFYPTFYFMGSGRDYWTGAAEKLSEEDYLYFNPKDPQITEALQLIKNYWFSDKVQDIFGPARNDKRMLGNPLLATWSLKGTGIRTEDVYASDSGSIYGLKGLYQWVDKILSDPNNFNRLIEREPHLKDKSRLHQIMGVLNDSPPGAPSWRHGPRDILPSYFYALWNILARGNALYQRPLLPETAEMLIRNKDSAFSLAAWDQGSYWSFMTYYQEYIEPQNTKLYPDPNDPHNKDIYAKNLIDSRFIEGNYHIKMAYRLLQDPTLNQIYTDSEFPISGKNFVARKLDNENIIWSAKTSNPQRTFALASILSEDRNQIKAVSSYILGNPGELADPEFQTFIELILFAGNLLIKEFRQPYGESLMGKLAALTTSQLLLYRSLGKFEELSFILHLNQLFRRYVEYSKPLAEVEQSSTFKTAFMETLKTLSSSEEAVIPGFLSTSAEIRKLLDRSDLSDQARSMLNQELVLCYSGRRHLSHAEIQEFLTAALFLKMHPIAPPYDSRQNELEVDWTIGFLKDELHTAVKGPHRDQLLNGLTSQLFKDKQARTWVQEPNTIAFTSQDGEYRFDLHSQTVIKKSVAQVQIPISKEIAQKAEIVEIFGKNFSAKTTQISPGVLQFSHEGYDYRLITKGAVFFVQKIFVKEGKKVWYQFTFATVEQLKYLPLIQGHLHWISESEPREILITDRLKKDPKYRAELSVISTIKTIHLLSNSKDTDLVLTDIQQPLNAEASAKEMAWYFLSNFEPFSHILIWEDSRTHDPKRIELPRFGPNGLSFDIKEFDGKKRAVSNNFSGFYIVEKQFVPALKEMPHYLLLQNAEGQQKVIVPRRKFTKEIGHKRNTALNTCFLKPETDADSPYIINQQSMVYDIDPKTGKLKPVSDEARLYLAMIYLWKMEYGLDSVIDEFGHTHERLALVQDYLVGSDSYLRPYTPSEIEILEWIATMREENADHDPRAVAVQLHAIYLLLKNQLDFSGPSLNLKISEFAPKLCDEYTVQLNNIHAVHLKESEIQLLSKQFPGIIPTKPQIIPNQTFGVQPVAPGEPQKIEAIDKVPNYYNQIVKSLKDDPYSVEIRQNAILRPAMIEHLPDAYSLVKGEITDRTKAEEIYKKITTLPTMPVEVDKWKAELGSVFELMLKARAESGKQEEWSAVRMLAAVLRSPQSFPSTEQFILLLNDTAAFMKQIGETLEKISPPQKIEPPIAPSESVPGPQRTMTTSPLQRKPIREFTVTLPPSISLHVKAPQPRLPAVSKADIAQIVWGESTPPVLGPRITVNEELQQVFAVATTDRVVANELSKVQASVSTAPSKSLWYSIKDIHRFRQLAADNRLKQIAQDQTLKQLESELIQLANKPAQTPTKASAELLQKIGESRTDITIEDLILMFWRRDPAEFQKRNPNLRVDLQDASKDDIVKLQNKIGQYLIEKTFAQHLNRLSLHMEVIEKAVAQKMPDAELNELLRQFVVMATAERPYNPAQHPEYLALEYFADILIRPDQVRNLDLLQLHNGKVGNPEALGIIIEIIMAAGKTSVLLALLGIINADGDHISIGIMPEELLPWVATGFESKQWGAFKQSVQVISFDRGTNISVNSLQRLLERLEHIRTNRQLLLMSSSSLLSLYLKFIEHWHNYLFDPLNPIIKQEIDLFRQIFTLLKEKGRLAVDEGDVIFNPRNENHFPVGKPAPMPEHEIDLILTFYEILTTNPDLQSLVSFEFFPTPGAPFTKELYETNQKIKPLIIDSILQKQLGSQDPAIRTFFENLKPEELSHLRTFLFKAPNKPKQPADQAAYDFVEKLAIPNLRDLLALAREEIQTFIPLTCSQVNRVHYGIFGSKPIARPFHGSDVPSKAEFGSIYETGGYTPQDYLKNREILITSPVVKKEIENLQNKAILEMKNDKRKALKDTEAYRQFMRLCGNNPRFHLFEMQNKIDELVKTIHKDAKLVLQFARYYAFPDINTYPLLFSANPQMLRLIFSSIQAFTGTLGSSAALPQGLLPVPAKEIMGKSLGILWNNSRKIHVIPKIDSKHFARDVIGKNPHVQHVNTIIDAGGLSHGVSRLAMAKEFLELPGYSDPKRKNPVNGVVFFNEKDELLILERGKADAVPLAQTTIPKTEWILVYDQKHTVGADIPNLPTAVALLTISQHTTLRELMQAMWRMRGVDKSQRIELAIDTDVKKMIFETLRKFTGKEHPDELKLEHILLFVTYNQAALQGDSNYRALKQKMLSLLQEQVYLALIDPLADHEATLKLFQETQKYFVQEITRSPWELFGKETVLKDSDEVVQHDLSRLTGDTAFQSLIINPFIISRTDPKRLTQSLNLLTIGAKGILPERLLTTPGKSFHGSPNEYGKNVEVEIQKDVHTQTNIQKEIVAASGPPIQRPSVVYPIPNEKYFQWSLYVPTSPDDLAKDNFIEVYGKFSKYSPRKHFLRFINTQVAPKASYYFPSTLFPVIRVSDTFGENVSSFSRMYDFKDVFDPNVLSLINIQPVNRWADKSGTSAVYFPFYKWQKSIADLLVVENAKSGEIVTIFLDEMDSANLKEVLLADQREFQVSSLLSPLTDLLPGDPRVRLCLYNFRLGDYVHGKDPITNLQTNPKFLRLVVQAKFFNGETDYSDDELIYLKAWIQEKGAARMYRLFTDYVLAFKATSKAKFPASTIGTLFKTLGFG